MDKFVESITGLNTSSLKVKLKSVCLENLQINYKHRVLKQQLFFHLHNGKVKVKLVPYTFVRRGVPAREDTYPQPSACEVGWPVPFLAAFISPVLPPGTHLLLGGQ